MSKKDNNEDPHGIKAMIYTFIGVGVGIGVYVTFITVVSTSIGVASGLYIDRALLRGGSNLASVFSVSHLTSKIIAGFVGGCTGFCFGLPSSILILSKLFR